MTGIDEEWEAAMTALRDLQATASRLCGEAAGTCLLREGLAVDADWKGHRCANSALFGHAPTCTHFVTTVLKEVRPT